MTDAVRRAQLQLAGMGLLMIQVSVWIHQHTDTMPDSVQSFLGATLLTVHRYGQTSHDVMADPTAQRPVMGRRCMFY